MITVLTCVYLKCITSLRLIVSRAVKFINIFPITHLIMTTNITIAMIRTATVATNATMSQLSLCATVNGRSFRIDRNESYNFSKRENVYVFLLVFYILVKVVCCGNEKSCEENLLFFKIEISLRPFK